MWQPGQTILDEYEVVKALGSGGMATVYLVREVERGSQMAVKVPHPHMIGSPADRLAFVREVQVWVTLPQHPHIVQCHFVREVDAAPAVFAEYVPAGTLAGWIERGRIHGPSHALDLGIQLAEALSITQQLGVVHRDVKPGNCLMDASGVLKISDFGLAGAREKLLEKRAQRKGADSRWARPIPGTPAYCSPEQFDGQSVDSRTDVWSFGVTLFEVLTGKRPALGPAARASVEAYTTTAPASAAPAATWQFLLSLLVLDPAQRPGSFADIVACLKEIYEQASGRRYPRQFAAHDGAATTAPPSRGIPYRQAHAILAHALRSVGRDPAEAEAFTLSAPLASRPQTAEALAEVALLNEAANVYRTALAQRQTDSHVLALAGVLHMIAKARHRLGDLPGAVSAYDEIVDRLRLLLPRSQNERVVMALGEAITNRAISHRQQGSVEQAIKGYQHGIALLGASRTTKLAPLILRETATLHQNRAMALKEGHRLKEAMEDINRALAIHERLARTSRGGGTDRVLAGVYLDRGVLHRNMGNASAAVEDYNRAIAIYRGGEAAGGSAADRDLALACVNRSIALVAMGDLPAAVEDLDEAVEMLQQFVERDRQEDLISDLARARNNRSNVLRIQGKTEAALADIDQCIALREQLVEKRGMTVHIGDLARAYCNKVLILSQTGRQRDALPVGERAVAWLASLVERRGRRDLLYDLAKARVIFGVARYDAGQAEPGRQEIARGIRDYEKLLGSGSSVDVLDGFAEALLTFVRVKPDDRARDTLLPVIGPSLRKLRDAVRQGAVVPLSAIGKLRGLRNLLPASGDTAIEIRAIIREISEHRSNARPK